MCPRTARRIRNLSYTAPCLNIPRVIFFQLCCFRKPPGQPAGSQHHSYSHRGPDSDKQSRFQNIQIQNIQRNIQARGKKNALTSAGSSDESQIVESSHVVLERRRVISQFRRVFFVVPSVDRHLRSIGDADLIQCNDLKARFETLEFDGRCLSRCPALVEPPARSIREIPQN